MNNLEKLYYNMDRLSDKYGDMKETKEAQDAMENAIGKEVLEKAEGAIYRCMSANEKQGFIYGFQYAVSLLMSGMEV